MSAKGDHGGVVFLFRGGEILFLRFHPVPDTPEYVHLPVHIYGSAGILGDRLGYLIDIAATLLPCPSGGKP